MSAASLPENEPDRVAALHALGVLDTGSDPRFDVFTRLASDMFDAPIALISLLDHDRQWFKSAHGLPDGLHQTPRDMAFCAHAILQPDAVMLVPDAAADARFSDNPLVTGPMGIRFYAGATLRDREGLPIGTLSVIDRVPRDASLFATRRLADLAVAVSTTLEWHGAMRALTLAAETDALTGLANRARFEAALADTLARPGAKATLLALDLDRFKAINDFFGHAGGDLALQETARRITKAVRPQDLVARLGGDAFAVLVPGEASPRAARAMAARILAALRQDFRIDGQQARLSGSVGVALAPRDGSLPALLGRAADTALFEAKRQGRDRVTLHPTPRATPDRRAVPPPNPAALGGRPALKLDLHDAVATGAGLSLHWQPVVDAGDFHVVGFEALSRWTRPCGAMVPPADFIPLAEAIGVVARIDARALDTACQEAAHWTTQRGAAPLGFAVNVSPAWLYVGDVATAVEHALAASGVAPHRLIIEITEGVMIAETGRARATIDRLQRLGVRVALDDFGAGHASLSYLDSFPFDRVKIDRSLISALAATDGRAAERAIAILRAVLQVSRALGAETVAEGVETEAQVAVLRAEGCKLLQGYRFGRPAPIATFAALVHAAPGGMAENLSPGPCFSPTSAAPCHAASRAS